MNPFEMVVAIVGITAIASVLRAKYGYRRRKAGDPDFAGHAADGDLAAENRLLRDEMRGMKERLQVLERLATDDETDARRLDREIEKLRDKPAVLKDRTGE
jgi:hypothetical protein